MAESIVGQTLKGRDKTIVVDKDALTISYSAAYHGFKGDKRIPYRRITAVQFREPGFMLAGYIQFSIQGAVEWQGAVFHDENAILFEKNDTARFRALKEFIDDAMARADNPTPMAPASVADELAKLADLKSRGILNEEEFNAQKAWLLRA